MEHRRKYERIREEKEQKRRKEKVQRAKEEYARQKEVKIDIESLVSHNALCIE